MVRESSSRSSALPDLCRCLLHHGVTNLLQGGGARGDMGKDHERETGPVVAEQQQQVAEAGRVPRPRAPAGSGPRVLRQGLLLPALQLKHQRNGSSRSCHQQCFLAICSPSLAAVASGVKRNGRGKGEEAVAATERGGGGGG